VQDAWTALMCAAAHDRADCVRLLIEAGADKDIRNNVCVDGRLLVLISPAPALSFIFINTYFLSLSHQPRSAHCSLLSCKRVWFYLLNIQILFISHQVSFPTFIVD
jgi:ankyrin repeat protein